MVQRLAHHPFKVEMRVRFPLGLPILLLAFFAVAAPAVWAQSNGPLSQKELDQITARGRLLFEYDFAAWHATDVVQPLNLPEGSIAAYVAQKKGTEWTVVWGRFNESRDRLLIVYEAAQGASREKFEVRKHDPPLEDTGFYFLAAKALQTGLADFGRASRPYNSVVLPAPSGEFYVYLLPAQTKNGVYPLGGDVRYRVSSDGSTIVEKRQLHRTILEVGDPNHSLQKAGGYHTHVLSEVPEDTDVFHVLRQERPVPEYVATRKYVYCVQPDGTIRFLGDLEKFLKKK